MSPSKDHERIKSYIGRLVEAFARERDIDLSPYGSKRSVWRFVVRIRTSLLVGPSEVGLHAGRQGAEGPGMSL